MYLSKFNSRKWQNQAKSGQTLALDCSGLIEVVMCEPQISVSYFCLETAALEYGDLPAANSDNKLFINSELSGLSYNYNITKLTNYIT